MQRMIRYAKRLEANVAMNRIFPLLLVGVLSVIGSVARAQTIPIYYFDDQGIESKSQALMERTISLLNEQFPEQNFQITPVDPTVRYFGNQMSRPGLFFGDASQSILLEHQISLRPIAIIERTFNDQQSIRGAGVVAARADSGLDRLQDISGRTVGGVRGKPLLSWLAVTQAAADGGIGLDSAPSQIDWFATDQDVVRALVDGDVEMGVISSSVIEGMAASGELVMDDLVVVSPGPDVAERTEDFLFLSSTDVYPDYRLMAFESLESDLVRQVGAAILSLSASDLFPGEALQLG